MAIAQNIKEKHKTMERKEYPNGIAVEVGIGDSAMFIARVFDDEKLKRTYEGEDADEKASTYARVLVRVKGHRALRN